MGRLKSLGNFIMIPLVIINEVTKYGFFPPLSSINLIKTTGIGERLVNIELTVLSTTFFQCIFYQVLFLPPSSSFFFSSLN